MKIQKPDTADRVSERLKGTMERFDLNILELAAYLGVTPPAVRHWLEGTRAPTRSTIKLIDVLATVEALAPDLHEQFLPQHLPMMGRGKRRVTKTQRHQSTDDLQP